MQAASIESAPREAERFTVLNDDGDEVVIPSRYVVCPACEGKGTHDHPAFCNGITSDEWNGQDWDEDSRAAYLGGEYDVPCHECKGLRVVLMPDHDRLTPEQRALLENQQRELAELRAAERSERFMFGIDA